MGRRIGARFQILLPSVIALTKFPHLLCWRYHRGVAECLKVNFVRLSAIEMGVNFRLPNQCYSQLLVQTSWYGPAMASMTLIIDFPLQLAGCRPVPHWLS